MTASKRVPKKGRVLGVSNLYQISLACLRVRLVSNIKVCIFFGVNIFNFFVCNISHVVDC